MPKKTERNITIKEHIVKQNILNNHLSSLVFQLPAFDSNEWHNFNKIPHQVPLSCGWFIFLAGRKSGNFLLTARQFNQLRCPQQLVTPLGPWERGETCPSFKRCETIESDVEIKSTTTQFNFGTVTIFWSMKVGENVGFRFLT